MGQDAALGLRERKKLWTRNALACAALDLCEKQGFEHTSVEQIADSVDISPRTFNRYFATKEEVIMAPAQEFAGAVVAELADQPRAGCELQALFVAHLRVIDKLAVGATQPSALLACKRLRQMNRIISEAPSVSAHSAHHAERKYEALSAEVARRMGCDVEDSQVLMTVRTWMTIMRVASEEWSSVASRRDDDQTDLAALADSVRRNYATFTAIAATLTQASSTV